MRRRGLWQRYDQVWNGPGGTRGDAKLVGSIGVIYDSPNRSQITIYRVIVTGAGELDGWTVERLCNDALSWVGLDLASCPRAELAGAPRADPFRLRPDGQLMKDDRRGTGQAGWVALLLLTTITVVAYEIAQLVEKHVYPHVGIVVDTFAAEAIEVAVISCVSASLVWPCVLAPLRRRTAAARVETMEREEALRADRNTQEFHAQLHRALEMANVEEGAHKVAQAGGLDAGTRVDRRAVARRLERGAPQAGHGARRQQRHGGLRGDALRTTARPSGAGQTAIYPADTDLDACPWLVDRADFATGAVCIPVSTIGRSIGVLHTRRPDRLAAGPRRDHPARGRGRAGRRPHRHASG